MKSKTTLYLLIGVWALTFGLAGLLLNTSLRYQKEGRYLGQALTEHALVGTNVRLQLLTLAGQEEIVSLQSQAPCLAYHLRVLLVSEVTDKKGSVSNHSELAYESQQGADPLLLQGNGRTYRLPLAMWDDFLAPEISQLEQAPAYLERRNKSEIRGDLLYYQVEESLIKTGQALFVAAQLVEEGRLSPDTRLGRVVVYPGSQAECVRAFESRAKFNLLGLGFLFFFGLLASVGIAKAMKSED